MSNKMTNFLSQGPVLAVILVVGTFLIIAPKDRPDYLYAAICGVLLALGSRFLDFLLDLSEQKE